MKPPRLLVKKMSSFQKYKVTKKIIKNPKFKSKSNEGHFLLLYSRSMKYRYLKAELSTKSDYA